MMYKCSPAMNRDPAAVVTLLNGNLVPMSFSDMIDPATNRMKIRLVDVTSDYYRVARAYMIRLERADLDNPDLLSRMAAEARLSPEQFRARYSEAATRLADGIPVK